MIRAANISKCSNRIIKVTSKELSIGVSFDTPALLFYSHMTKSLYVSLPNSLSPLMCDTELTRQAPPPTQMLRHPVATSCDASDTLSTTRLPTADTHKPMSTDCKQHSCNAFSAQIREEGRS